MNKALHIFTYLFLALAGAALYFELQLNAKRELLTDRNQLQEDYLVKIARTIEKAAPDTDITAEIKKDVSPVEAKIIDIPDTENLLSEYKAFLEQRDLATFNWDTASIREQLKAVYVLDGEGKVEMIGGRPLMKGVGTEDELLSKLLNACQDQQSRLNTTRSELTEMRNRLKSVTDELNALKLEDRQDKVTIVERDAKIAKLEQEKADLENQIVKFKARISDLETDLTSLKDELVRTRDELEVTKEDLAKAQKNIEQLNKLIKEMVATQGSKLTRGIVSIPAGDKGEIVAVNNESMFAIVRFSDDAMRELKGKDLSQPLPALEVSVKRTGFSGEAGEFVGRLRLRQEVPGKNFVICDILAAWEQSKLTVGDIVFAD